MTVTCQTLDVKNLQKIHKSNWNPHKYCKISFPFIIRMNVGKMFSPLLFCHYVSICIICFSLYARMLLELNKVELSIHS